MSVPQIQTTYPYGEEGPISRLPLELLVAVFKVLPCKEKTFCTGTTQLWSILVFSFWPELKLAPKDQLIHACSAGKTELAVLAKNRGATNFNEALKEAGIKGHVSCMKLAKQWGATLDDELLSYEIARTGQIACLKLLKSWNEMDGLLLSNWALRGAAEGGHLSCMRLIKEWGAIPDGNAMASTNATNFFMAQDYAASCGRVESLKLLKAWGALDADNVLMVAAEEGQIECMRLAKKWGATEFDEALGNAMSYGHIRCCELIEQWIIDIKG